MTHPLYIYYRNNITMAKMIEQSAEGTPEQEAWLADLARVPGVETYLWRPRDAESIREVIA